MLLGVACILLDRQKIMFLTSLCVSVCVCSCLVILVAAGLSWSLLVSQVPGLCLVRFWFMFFSCCRAPLVFIMSPAPQAVLGFPRRQPG